MFAKNFKFLGLFLALGLACLHTDELMAPRLNIILTPNEGDLISKYHDFDDDAEKTAVFPAVAELTAKLLEEVKEEFEYVQFNIDGGDDFHENTSAEHRKSFDLVGKLNSALNDLFDAWLDDNNKPAQKYFSIFEPQTPPGSPAQSHSPAAPFPPAPPPAPAAEAPAPQGPAQPPAPLRPPSPAASVSVRSGPPPSPLAPAPAPLLPDLAAGPRLGGDFVLPPPPGTPTPRSGSPSPAAGRLSPLSLFHAGPPAPLSSSALGAGSGQGFPIPPPPQAPPAMLGSAADISSEELIRRLEEFLRSATPQPPMPPPPPAPPTVAEDLAKFLSDGLFLADQFCGMSLLPDKPSTDIVVEGGGWFGGERKAGAFDIVEAGPFKKLELLRKAPEQYDASHGADWFAKKSGLLKWFVERDRALAADFEAVAKAIDDQRIAKLVEVSGQPDTFTTSHNIIGTRSMPIYWMELLEIASDLQRFVQRAAMSDGEIEVRAESEATADTRVANVSIAELRAQIHEVLYGHVAPGQTPDDGKPDDGGLVRILEKPADSDGHWDLHEDFVKDAVTDFASGAREEVVIRRAFLKFANSLSNLDANLATLVQSSSSEVVTIDGENLTGLAGVATSIHQQTLNFMDWYLHRDQKLLNVFELPEDFKLKTIPNSGEGRPPAVLASLFLLDRMRLYKGFKTTCGLLGVNRMPLLKGSSTEATFYDSGGGRDKCYLDFVKGSPQLGRSERFKFSRAYIDFLDERAEKLAEGYLKAQTQRTLGKEATDAILMQEQDQPAVVAQRGYEDIPDLVVHPCCCGHTGQQLAVMMAYREHPDLQNYRMLFEHPTTFPWLQMLGWNLALPELTDGVLDFYHDPSVFRCAWCATLYSIDKSFISSEGGEISKSSPSDSYFKALFDLVVLAQYNIGEVSVFPRGQRYNRGWFEIWKQQLPAFRLHLGNIAVQFEAGALRWTGNWKHPLEVGFADPRAYNADDEGSFSGSDSSLRSSVSAGYEPDNFAVPGMEIFVVEGLNETPLAAFLQSQGVDGDDLMAQVNTYKIRWARAIQDLFLRFLVIYRAEIIAEQKRAATKIQSAWRGYRARGDLRQQEWASDQKAQRKTPSFSRQSPQSPPSPPLSPSLVPPPLGSPPSHRPPAAFFAAGQPSLPVHLGTAHGGPPTHGLGASGGPGLLSLSSTPSPHSPAGPPSRPSSRRGSPGPSLDASGGAGFASFTAGGVGPAGPMLQASDSALPQGTLGSLGADVSGAKALPLRAAPASGETTAITAPSVHRASAEAVHGDGAGPASASPWASLGSQPHPDVVRLLVSSLSQDPTTHSGLTTTLRPGAAASLRAGDPKAALDLLVDEARATQALAASGPTSPGSVVSPRQVGVEDLGGSGRRSGSFRLAPEPSPSSADPLSMPSLPSESVPGGPRHRMRKPADLGGIVLGPEGQLHAAFRPDQAVMASVLVSSPPPTGGRRRGRRSPSSLSFSQSQGSEDLSDAQRDIFSAAVDLGTGLAASQASSFTSPPEGPTSSPKLRRRRRRRSPRSGPETTSPSELTGTSLPPDPGALGPLAASSVFAGPPAAPTHPSSGAPTTTTSAPTLAPAPGEEWTPTPQGPPDRPGGGGGSAGAMVTPEHLFPSATTAPLAPSTLGGSWSVREGPDVAEGPQASRAPHGPRLLSAGVPEGTTITAPLSLTGRPRRASVRRGSGGGSSVRGLSAPQDPIDMFLKGLYINVGVPLEDRPYVESVLRQVRTKLELGLGAGDFADKKDLADHLESKTPREKVVEWVRVLEQRIIFIKNARDAGLRDIEINGILSTLEKLGMPLQDLNEQFKHQEMPFIVWIKYFLRGHSAFQQDVNVHQALAMLDRALSRQNPGTKLAVKAAPGRRQSLGELRSLTAQAQALERGAPVGPTSLVRGSRPFSDAELSGFRSRMLEDLGKYLKKGKRNKGIKKITERLKVVESAMTTDAAKTHHNEKLRSIYDELWAKRVELEESRAASKAKKGRPRGGAGGSYSALSESEPDSASVTDDYLDQALAGMDAFSAQTDEASTASSATIQLEDSPRLAAGPVSPERLKAEAEVFIKQMEQLPKYPDPDQKNSYYSSMALKMIQRRKRGNNDGYEELADFVEEQSKRFGDLGVAHSQDFASSLHGVARGHGPLITALTPEASPPPSRFSRVTRVFGRKGSSKSRLNAASLARLDAATSAADGRGDSDSSFSSPLSPKLRGQLGLHHGDSKNWTTHRRSQDSHSRNVTLGGSAAGAVKEVFGSTLSEKARFEERVKERGNGPNREIAVAGTADIGLGASLDLPGGATVGISPPQNRSRSRSPRPAPSRVGGHWTPSGLGGGTFSSVLPLASPPPSSPSSREARPSRRGVRSSSPPRATERGEPFTAENMWPEGPGAMERGAGRQPPQMTGSRRSSSRSSSESWDSPPVASGIPGGTPRGGPGSGPRPSVTFAPTPTSSRPG